MIELLYRLLILPLGILGWVMALPFSAKARAGWSGRRNWRAGLSDHSAQWGQRPRIWFHCSSLGEFEQAVPVLRELRAAWPDAVLVATVYSPSGYEKARASGVADWVGYLPFDTRRNVAGLMSIIRPAALVFMRYDMWPALVGGARRGGVPIVIASAALNPRSPLRSPLLRPIVRFLYGGSVILAVNGEEAASFEGLVGEHARVRLAGDPRYDRARQRCQESGPRGSDLFPPDSMILVAGSTHAPDERRVVEALSPWPNPALRLLVVPHDPSERRLRQVERLLASADLSYQRWSTLRSGQATARAVIVDGVGHLAHLYRGCHLAYVGGGFTSGVHSVLEPAAAGVPAVFGPRHWRSPEARALVKRGGALVVRTEGDLGGVAKFLLGDGEGERKRMAKVCLGLIEEGVGASRTVAREVQQLGQG
jgi:3-deoxy-D-manno-octulosonic-acid transferase